MTKKTLMFIIGGSICGCALTGAMIFLFLFRSPNSEKGQEVFTITSESQKNVSNRLAESGFIRYPWILNLVFSLQGQKPIQAGGYTLSKDMSVWQIADALTGEPDLKWVTIPEGLRKEEIGERLAKTLGWSSDELENWNTTYTAMTYDNFEGVYFPDTYLIPVKENGLDIAKRLQNRFNEKFEPYLPQFAQQNILWTTGLRLASLVQREAAGSEDMPLIAGILWNRLLKEQKLEVDATVEYARGNTGAGWWAPATPADIQTIESPYNTYKNKGLPPHPIANPGIAAIEAVLHPEETKCFYYLHDSNRQIHCAATLEEHEKNIDVYLK